MMCENQATVHGLLRRILAPAATGISFPWNQSNDEAQDRIYAKQICSFMYRVRICNLGWHLFPSKIASESALCGPICHKFGTRLT